MTEIKVLAGTEGFENLDTKKVALIDVEGTLTPDNKKVPEDPEPEHVYKIFDGKSFEVKTDLGYWSGLHLLAGERPSEYFKRVENWWNGKTSREEFEEQNVKQLNTLLENTDHDTAQELVEWYNKSFLDLRNESQELVGVLKNAGHAVGIISHTSESLSKTVASEVEADFVVPAWRFKFKNGKFEYIEKKVYADDKSEVLTELDEAGIKEVAFIGNGENDVQIAEQADKAYMVENEEVIDYEKVDARTGDFERVLKAIKDDFKGGN